MLLMFSWLLCQQAAARCPTLPQIQHFDVEVVDVDFFLSFVVFVSLLVVLDLVVVVIASTRGTDEAS